MKPIHAFALVLVFAAGVLAADFALEGGFSYGAYERVAPERDGSLRIDIAGLEANQVRFFRFLNTGNQEVKFFIGRDSDEHVQVGFDANEMCYKLKRGYSAAEGWLTCRKCDKSFELAAVNAGGGGCKPVPLQHRVVGDEVHLTEAQILQGWRFFR